MKFFQRLAPLQVPHTRHRVRIARDHPATQMLAARGESQRFGGVRAEPQDPIRQPSGVDRFARMRPAVYRFHVRVARVFLVEPAHCSLESFSADKLNFFTHNWSYCKSELLWQE